MLTKDSAGIQMVDAVNQTHGHGLYQGKGLGSDQGDGNIDSAPVSEKSASAWLDNRMTKVFHPWGHVDYHLYLSSVERNSSQERCNSMYFINDDEPYAINARDVLDPQHFGPGGASRNPKLLFHVLPIADDTGNGYVFGARKYALGYDYNTDSLFAREFNHFPETADLWDCWDHGDDRYCITIPSLLQLLSACFSGNRHHEMTILQSARTDMSQKRNDPGLEIVMVILFTQWIIDLGDFLFAEEGKEGIAGDVIQELQGYMDASRLLLQRASCRAWFAFRDGVSIAEYAHNSVMERLTNNLFSFPA